MHFMSAAHLTSRGVLVITGPDRKDFLQGLVTNDVTKLTPGNALYAAMLTPQGKYLFDFIMIEDDDVLYLDCEGARAGDLERRLTMYKLRADVEVRNASETHAVLAFWDEDPTLPDNCIIVADPRHRELGWRAIVPREAVGDAGPEGAYDLHRLAQGIPVPGDFEVDKLLILEGNLAELHGVSFTKGCYVGQELTARMNHRGKVRKRLVPVIVDGNLPEPGTPVTANGKSVGELRTGRGNLAIALLRIEDVADGDKLTCADATLTVNVPGWLAPRMIAPT